MGQNAGRLAIISDPIWRTRVLSGRRSLAILLALFSGTLLVSACSVESAGTAGTTPSPQKAVFTTGKTYQYNKLIGHSRATSGTNDNVSVTVTYLDTGGVSGTSSLQLAFNDADPQLSAHFLFKELTNVYLVDDHSARYQAISAKPDDIIINPQQGGTVLFLVPALHADAGTLAVYVNTDRSALETQCTVLKPDQTTSPCDTEGVVSSWGPAWRMGARWSVAGISTPSPNWRIPAGISGDAPLARRAHRRRAWARTSSRSASTAGASSAPWLSRPQQ